MGEKFGILPFAYYKIIYIGFYIYFESYFDLTTFLFVFFVFST